MDGVPGELDKISRIIHSTREFWRYLHQRYGHVTTERVVSGPALVNIYMWLKNSGRNVEPNILI